jgi:PAS domain S-box-containing protein
MATSPDFVRLAGGATRALTEIAFEALREAVIVVDVRLRHFPLVLVNTAARQCLLGRSASGTLLESSLYSLLGAATDSAVEAALASSVSGTQSVTRILPWRFPQGETVVSTELKVLASALGQSLLMFTFSEPSGGSDVSATEHFPADLLILDSHLNVTYANASAVRTAGGIPGGILSCSGLTLVPTAAIPREVFARALTGEYFHEDAMAVATPGDPVRWFDVDVQPLKDASGIAGVAVLSMEVTERRRGKPDLAGSDLRLRTLTEHARDIITVCGRDGRLQYIAGGLKDSLGYVAEESCSNSMFELVHPDDVEALRAKYSQLVNGSIGTFSHQFRVRHQDGSYRWFDARYASALDNPLIEGVVVNSRDITERRQAESHLAQREEVFRLATEAVNGIIFEWDIGRGIVHRSRGIQEVLGLEPDELIEAGAWSARIHPQDEPVYNAKIDAAFVSGRGWTATYRIRDVRGRYRSLLERGLIQRSEDGVPARAIGCAVDVSEIKRLTDLLAETQRAAKMGGWEYSYVTRELTWTDEMFRIYETSPRDFEVSWESMLSRCTPESRQRFNDAYEAAEATHGDFDLELEIITLAEQRFWVRIIGHLEKLQERPFRAFGSVQNVQAQKSAQIALENSTRWLKLSMNMAHLHAWRWDRATDSLEFAILDGHMVHLPRAFPGMKRLMARVHPQDRSAIESSIERAFAEHREIQEEFRLRSHDGQYRSYAAIARPLYDSANQPSGLVGVTQDITARHLSEARVRRSEELLRTTTANTADTLLLVDTDLRVRFINRGVHGMGIDDIIGRPIAIILPPSAHNEVVAKLLHVLLTAVPAAYEFFVAAAGEETQYFENRAVLVRDEGIGRCISITIRDITERKRLEQEVLVVSGRERHTIGRDLHDGLGQELTGVALMLRGLATRIQKQAPESVGQVNEIVRLVNQSIETARALARGLLPVNTDSGGLPCALRALADRGRDLYGFKVDFRAEVAPAIDLSETNASHLYRIAQEALTNTARHAQADAVEVYLLITESRFVLQISDDGVGIDAGVGVGEAAPAACGMGLKIMKYRASMIGATLDILPQQPRGTVVRVTGGQPMVMSAVQSAQAI